jgi:hypothetical protein
MIVAAMARAEAQKGLSKEVVESAFHVQAAPSPSKSKVLAPVSAALFQPEPQQSHNPVRYS